MTPQELAEEIRDYLRSNSISYSSFAIGECSEAEYQELIEMYGDMECVEEERNPYKNNHELQDEFFIVHFPKLNIYLKLESEYNSWDSSRDGDVYPVEPYKNNVTKYRKTT